MLPLAEEIILLEAVEKPVAFEDGCGEPDRTLVARDGKALLREAPEEIASTADDDGKEP